MASSDPVTTSSAAGKKLRFLSRGRVGDAVSRLGLIDIVISLPRAALQGARGASLAFSSQLFVGSAEHLSDRAVPREPS